MRRLLLGLLGLAALALAAPVAAIELTDGARPAVADLAFETLDGKPARLSDFRGRVVVLNVWATWCVPCREEMPSLDRLQAAFPDGDLVVLALSVDRGGPEKVRRFLEEIGVRRLHVYRDPKMRATFALRIPGLPATILVDRKGREAYRHLGLARWDEKDVIEALRRLLAEPES